MIVVVAVPVGLLIYSSSGIGGQQEGMGEEGRGDTYASGDQQEVMAEQDSGDNVCTKAEQQEASNEELNGKITFTSQIYAGSSAGASAGASVASARESSAAPVIWRSDSEVCVMNADGTDMTRLTDTPESEGTPTWLPEGERIAFVISDANGEGDVYVMNANGSNLTRLPWPEGPRPKGAVPAWSPDGERVAFEADCNIYIMPSDGSSAPKKLTTHPVWECVSDPAWSPDGTEIAFSTTRNDCSGNHAPTTDLYKIDVNTRKETRLTTGPGSQDDPTWSPDGEKIAFSSWEYASFASNGIYVMNADGSNTTPVFEAVGVSASAPDWQPLP